MDFKKLFAAVRVVVLIPKDLKCGGYKDIAVVSHFRSLSVFCNLVFKLGIFI